MQRFMETHAEEKGPWGGAMIVGGSFLENFTFPLRIKCPKTTLLAAFNEKMTFEQYLHS